MQVLFLLEKIGKLRLIKDEVVQKCVMVMHEVTTLISSLNQPARIFRYQKGDTR